jgi:hypothetical protein
MGMVFAYYLSNISNIISEVNNEEKFKVIRKNHTALPWNNNCIWLPEFKDSWGAKKRDDRGKK